MFYATAGWDANRVRSAFGTGTVSRGGDTEHFEVEIDRASGQVRTHLLSSNLTMIAGPNGGYVVRPDGSRNPLTLTEVVQNGASCLIPIFTAIGELDLGASILSNSSDPPFSNTIAVTKVSRFGNSTDEARTKAQTIEASFDPASHLLRSITLHSAAKDTPATTFPILVEYSDWRPEAGVLLPHVIKESVAGNEEFTATFSSLQLNAPITDQDFQ